MAETVLPTSHSSTPPEETDEQRKVSFPFQILYFLSTISGHLTILPTVIMLLPLQIRMLDPHTSEITLGWVEAVGGIASVIAAPIIGAISDRTTARLGRRRFWMLISAVCVALSLLLMANSQLIWMLALGWFLVQFFADSITTLLQAIIPDRIPRKQRGLLSSYVGLATPLAAVLGSIIVAVIFKKNQLSAYYVLMGIVLVMVLLFTLVYREKPISKNEVPPFQLGAFLKKFWVSPRKHPDFAWAFVTRLLLFLGYFAVTTFLQYYLKDVLQYEKLFPGKTVNDGILAFQSTLLVPMLLSSFVGGIISDKLQRRKPVVTAAALLVMISFLIPAFATSWIAVQIWAVVLGIGYGAFFAVDTALATQVLPNKEDRGKDIGIIALALALPQIFSPMIGSGVLALTQRSYSALFVVGAIFALFSAVLVWRIKSVR
ncbi:putative MFS family arabinose efflux permease [Thermosporothrix hazakensis]|jgi:MFS family permease|uniref:MFS transporter n=2 Tax=Thermosporothrix TaxID=768650 RepID=A0A455SE44_9CHLR|nr:MFS transporter [Thermosporothrix hazakensis]PZW23607.1 putative MFS family arabinose efflux permease [Thermosporothrix hazakensis]BBH86723.1 MFS transporter [Thermosporothrix sp. COM3]GCE51026.1 MFS transporter [Thermosporothrix hazakensis]